MPSVIYVCLHGYIVVAEQICLDSTMLNSKYLCYCIEKLDYVQAFWREQIFFKHSQESQKKFIGMLMNFKTGVREQKRV